MFCSTSEMIFCPSESGIAWFSRLEKSEENRRSETNMDTSTSSKSKAWKRLANRWRKRTNSSLSPRALQHSSGILIRSVGMVRCASSAVMT